VALELLLRAFSGGWLFAWPNFVLSARSVLAEKQETAFVHDKRTGHVPRAGYSVPGITINKEGMRAHDGTVSKDGKPIIAAGDSFTFGAEVSDQETWPAALQRLTGRRVLNGGVTAYGFDQSVLRAEALAATHPPSAIVVSFIADDIRRTEMRRMWGVEKPYFDLAGDKGGGKLVPRNVPVPLPPDPFSTLNFWQRTLGNSYLFDFILRRLDLLYDWYGDHVRVHPAGTGERIACLLTDRLGELQKISGAPVLLVAEYDPVVWDDPKFAAEQRRMTQGLLDCARKNGVGTLDSFEALAADKDAGGPRGLYVMWHMNAKGNALIARLVAKALDLKVD
jgi:lysophospholipase L1-like esterase